MGNCPRGADEHWFAVCQATQVAAGWRVARRKRLCKRLRLLAGAALVTVGFRLAGCSFLPEFVPEDGLDVHQL